MSNSRIEEIQSLANKFLYSLYEKRREKNKFQKDTLSYMSRNSKLSGYNIESNSSFHSYIEKMKAIQRRKTKLKEKQKLNSNLYKNLEPWIPPIKIGKYFDKFKLLPIEHNLSNWEKVIN